MQGSDAGAARAPGGRRRAGMRARRPRDRARRAPPTYMLRAYMDHDLNVIGAAVVMLGDRIRDATEDASGMGGALPAALSALHVWAGGRTIETLAGGLRLSHSRTVRVVDRLAADGLATRTICRLCDAQACGHHDGRCPVTRAADAAEAVR